MSHDRRYDKTWEFISKSLRPSSVIFDIGTPNTFSEILTNKGFTVLNTKGDDLDDNPEVVKNFKADAVTALEILEHLINPLSVLRSLDSNLLFASVPLSLWFAKAYRNKKNKWDQHFHEFEDWQFDWLLEKAGWEIARSEKWTFPVYKLGVRPFLRSITPRYYIVEARRR
ncbi:MAG TPA: methyltransferase [Cyclobacteriaceae bacterium]|nr:methyltransferase [Cyclobacteriaceae bacterium]